MNFIGAVLAKLICRLHFHINQPDPKEYHQQGGGHITCPASNTRASIPAKPRRISKVKRCRKE